jgi:hypothetical protein
MSYDLNFWREKPGIKLDPQMTYEQLSHGEWVEGLEDLPIEQILKRIQEAFTQGWTKLDFQSWEAPGKGFQIFTTPQSFRVDCGGITGEEMNLFIDIAAEFGCPLYDPQVGQRFDRA